MKSLDENKIINAIETAQKILKTIEEVKDGKESNSFSELNEFRDSNSKADGLFKKLANEKNYILNDNNKDRDIAKLLTTLSVRSKKRHLRSHILKITAGVAAAVMVLSFFLWQKQEQNIISENSGNEITTPVIILSSGKNVSINTDKVLDVKKYENAITNANTTTIANDEHNAFNTILVPHKYTLEVVLDDGTKVTLNANSELQYPTKFKGAKREVYLKGEAFFDVTKSEKPFIVSTGSMNIKVYGTKFNVNAGEHDVCETVLISGSVGVTTNENSEVMIQPNQLFSYHKKEKQFTVKNIEPSLYVTWMSDYLSCHKEPLSRFLRKIATWYGVEFSLNNDIYQKMDVTISLSKKLSVEEFLEIVGYSLDLNFEKTATNKFNVHSKKIKMND